mmetsp:Transcript_8484/g.24184  ORF Transcript_8484/g.24184 Transcript_8484/m.24184 type:complete len:84 (-) Transcript_8484:1281-1532(-)
MFSCPLRGHVNQALTLQRMHQSPVPIKCEAAQLINSSSYMVGPLPAHHRPQLVDEGWGCSSDTCCVTWRPSPEICFAAASWEG